MTTWKHFSSAVVFSGVAIVAGTSALAQTPPPADPPPAAAPAPAAPTPADAVAPTATEPPVAPGSDASLPPVEVIQQQPEPAPQPKPQVVKKPKPAQQAAPKAKPKKIARPKPKPQPAPPPQQQFPVPQPPPPEPEVVQQQPADVLTNPVYGAPGGIGAAERASQSAQTPVNPQALVPANLQGFSSAATNLTPEKLKAEQPRNLNEAVKKVPGIIVINDDAAGHHGGMGMRGSPARRSRKLLVMEDGHPVNLALWLDPSVHYFMPIERVEGIEVIRGSIITHGPNNNFGVINARNLSPFGPNETVVSTAIGFTKTRGGFFDVIDEDTGDVEETRRKGIEIDISSRWHVHTRQTSGNVGLVLSYTGADVQGAWDTERLRFHDFYGALGWKGTDKDLVVSVMYARQRDKYDEQNFLTEFELEGDFANEDDAEAAAEALAEANRGGAERMFFKLGACKSCYAPAAGLNNYNGEIWRSQIVHNAYLDKDTTITSRLYAGSHRRDRYQLISFDSDPDGNAGAGPVPLLDDDGEQEGWVFGEDTMFGRLRTFRHIGGEIRGEWANRNILGFNQALQAGIRYEYQDMTNRNFLGAEDEILKDGDETGATLFDRSLKSNAVSAFLQSNIKVAQDFNVVPGIRFEWARYNRRNKVIAREESEAGGNDDCEDFGFEDDECLDIDGIVFDPERRKEGYSTFNALPGISFAYTGLYKTTVFGGYHRGLSTGVLRNEDFPAPDEIGDNFNLGFRTQAFRGLDLQVVGFHHILEDYQYGASFSDASDRSFGRAEGAKSTGIELYGRLNSQPFTGSDLNFYGEGNYTYARSVFTDASAFDDDGNVVGNFNGNWLPEVPRHIAALTIGVERKTGWRWDASMTWTYRGKFFTDEGNTPYGVYESECDGPDGGGAGEYECEVEEAGEDGAVPGIWLLSARFNLDIGNTGASWFIAGDNLLDKQYITDREDGLKPGLGRTIWTGFKYKF